MPAFYLLSSKVSWKKWKKALLLVRMPATLRYMYTTVKCTLLIPTKFRSALQDVMLLERHSKSQAPKLWNLCTMLKYGFLPIVWAMWWATCRPAGLLFRVWAAKGALRKSPPRYRLLKWTNTLPRLAH